jgi:hypothetical protein
MLSIVTFTLGPVATNSYLIADDSTGEPVIDQLLRGFKSSTRQKAGVGGLGYLADPRSFDHIAGAGEVAMPAALIHHWRCTEDYPLWRLQGGAPLFGMRIDRSRTTIDLFHGQTLHLGVAGWRSGMLPGIRGHVMFYCAADQVLSVGMSSSRAASGGQTCPGDYKP